MSLSMKALGLAICLYLVAGLAGASEYQFGTKVLAGDSDIGRPLFAMPATDICFWDTGVIPGYDDTDVVYIKVLPGPFIGANDLRLTPFVNLPAGSKVTPTDNDIGMLLTLFPPGKAIRFLNLFGSSLYDLMDPVYFSQSGPNSVVNDVRLNATVGSGLEAGTKVHDFEPDLNLAFGTPSLVTFPGAGLCFFDVNGNGVYDYWDDVYMNVPSGFPAEVSVNNIRLSGPV